MFSTKWYNEGTKNSVKAKNRPHFTVQLCQTGREKGTAMRKRIMKTLAMLGLSVCILVGGAVSGVAEEPARKECKENEHKWKTFVEYREDCVPTDFTLEERPSPSARTAARRAEKTPYSA